MLHEFLIGVAVGALTITTGAVFGYEIGRASRAGRPLLRVRRKPKAEDEMPEREYMDTRL